jgi:hypothetical protein
MFEENVNTIVKESNDQLDILKIYITYRTTYFVERVLNRIKVNESFPGFQMIITDSEPVNFRILQKAYDAWEHDKAPVIAAVAISINELDDDIIKLTYI